MDPCGKTYPWVLLPCTVIKYAPSVVLNYPLMNAFRHYGLT